LDEVLDALYFVRWDSSMLRGLPPRYDPTEDEAGKRELFASMTVADNLALGAFAVRRSGNVGASLADVYQRFPRLADRKTQLAATLSGGERQMLALGRALMSRPKLLMLDEPSLGLAPLIVREIFNIVTALKATGVSILLVEQNVETALKLCPRVVLMEKGTIVYTGASHDLKSQPEIMHRYLGLSLKH